METVGRVRSPGVFPFAEQIDPISFAGDNFVPRYRVPQQIATAVTN